MGAAAMTQTSPDRARLQLDTFFKAALATRRFRARFAERVKSTSQTEARWSALYFLWHAPDGLIQSDLAERMGVQGPTLVRLLDALEAQDLVKRTEAPGDRRAKRVRIQPSGESIVAEVDAVAAQMRDDVFASVSDEDLATTLHVLDVIVNALAPAQDSPARNRRASQPGFHVLDNR